MADKFIKIQFKADTEGLTSGLNKADKDIQGFGDRLGKWSKIAGAAFLAAGAAAAAYAGKLAIDGVKAAIEDSAAQEKLAQSLKNVTGATDAQIAATEDYITKTTLATGVADDELRPSLDRLVKSTKDITSAQKLQALALDISAGSGKSLDTVTQALAKAYEGNTTSLGRLGVGLDKAQLKSMTFDEITANLSKTFKDQASVQADTFAGKMDRLKVAFDEGKETVGGFILNAITPMVTKFVDKVIPAISEVAGNLGENLGPIFKDIGTFLKNVFGPVLDGIQSAFNKVKKAISDNSENLAPLLDLMKAVGTFAKDTLAPIIGKILGGAFDILGTALSKAIGFLGTVVDKLRDAWEWAKKLIDRLKNIDFNPFNNASFTSAGFTNAAFRAASNGGTNGPITYFGGRTLSELGNPDATGYNRAATLRAALGSGLTLEESGLTSTEISQIIGYARQNAEGLLTEQRATELIAEGRQVITNNYNITIPGTVVDPEGTARAINNVITDSASRTGDYGSFGTSRVGLSAVLV